jgi:polar amino acid transport system substrate-binding protein
VILIAVVATYAILAATNRLASGSSGTGATSVLDQAVARGTLRAGIPVAGLPVASRNAAGQIEGVVPDMAAEMAKALGVKLEIVDTPAPDRIPFLQAGKIDFSIGTVTQERAKAVGFSNIWAVDATSPAWLKSSGISTLDDVKGKKIVVVTGATGDLVATKRFPDNPIQRVDLASTAIQTVLSGQADVVFDDRSALALAAADNANLVLGPALTTEPSGVMVPLGDQKWINWVNYFLADYYSSGVSTCGCGKDSYKKWFKTDPLPLTFNY